MIKNLLKIGIFCEELADGLIIHGQHVKPAYDKKYVQIKTYNDHRIAMAFTILAIYYFNFNHHIQIIIDDKFCVNKTFPTFFQHLQSDLSIQTQSY